MQSDSREKSGRLTQLCKMILFSFLRHQITRSRWKGGTRTIGIENVLLSMRQQISQCSASLSPRGTIAIKHENNEFKSHSKSILRSLLLQPNNERLLKWSKNNFTCRSLRWCPGPDEEREKRFHHEGAYVARSRGGFPMARQTQKAVNEVMLENAKARAGKNWIMKRLFIRHCAPHEKLQRRH